MKYLRSSAADAGRLCIRPYSKLAAQYSIQSAINRL